MSSLIEGYNYDIFISYRQKDNKGDKWVSKFVDALKTELEATFKEDISVYFDENPHDRLQETHNVDKSLESKLNCLIFIPILSQTYCDPNSYAWQNEFLPFLKMAGNDRFGKDIRLRNGNVASRILPIRLHDLEQEDVKLFEKETGSVLRALDFVFRTSTGVSRPLKVNEDHPQDNLNKTFFSDQINKAGYAIKEIILGMKAVPIHVVEKSTMHKEPLEEVRKEVGTEAKEKSVKLSKIRLLSVVFITLILIIAAILAYPKIFKRDALEKLQSSGERIVVAVMPFQNMTNDTSLNIWQDGIQDILINSLSNYQELKVFPEESINTVLENNNFSNTTSSALTDAYKVSKKLKSNLLICGSIKQSGLNLRISTQIINPVSESVIKSFQIDGTSEDILHLNDSISVSVSNFLLISLLKKRNLEFQNLTSTYSPEAYKYFLYGKEARFNGDLVAAKKWIKQALEIDSNFIEAERHIAIIDQILDWEEGKRLILRIYNKRDKLSLYQRLSVDKIYAEYFETPNEVLNIIYQLQKLDDQNPQIYYNLGLNYNFLDQFEKAIPEFKKALEIYESWNSKPRIAYYLNLGYSYYKTGQIKEIGKISRIVENDYPDTKAIILIWYQAVMSLQKKDTTSANQFIKQLLLTWKNNSVSEAETITNLAVIYSDAGFLTEAEEYYRKALSLQPESNSRMYFLAKFLIDTDKNINEGMELLNQGAKLNPSEYQNYLFLDCYGWGLYKQGKFKEALEILQKSWELRRQRTFYYHVAFLHLEAAKKAVTNQKNN